MLSIAVAIKCALYDFRRFFGHRRVEIKYIASLKNVIMKKLSFLFVFLPMVALAQDKEQSFTIVGKAKDLTPQPNWVFIQYRSQGAWQKDSAAIINGKYTLKGTIEEPVIAYMSVKYNDETDGEDVTTRASRDRTTIFIEPGKIKTKSEDSISNIKVKSSLAHVEYDKLKKSLQIKTKEN